MDRKNFLRKGLAGLGTIIALPGALAACNGDQGGGNTAKDQNSPDCQLAPRETRGPFPNKTPAELVRENIIADRTGVPLLFTLTIKDQQNNCRPLAGVYVDVWHCDKDGYYSQYGDHRLQREDFRNAEFLRGRQLTDANGQVSFISIYPGWYPGRAPHIHVEVLDKDDNSLRVTQIAFPEDVSMTVYGTSGYRGGADISNTSDGIFRDSLTDNMADAVTGNTTDGYTLLKTIVV